MAEYYDRIVVVFIHEEGVFGSIEKMGAFASPVKYIKDGEEQVVVMENEEFSIVDEIGFEHLEEE